MSDSDASVEDLIGPLDVVYCGACSLPPEYCEFVSKKCKDCKPWLLKNMDREFLVKYKLIEEEGGEEELAEGMEGASLGEGGEKLAVKTKKGEPVGKGDKLMPGGKVKKKEPICVTVERLSRNKRKSTTVVIGLERFGVDLKAAAKVFKKKFSCGCAHVKGDAGKPDEIDIQGDFLDEVCGMLAEHKDFTDVPEEVIYIKEGSKKKAAFQ